MPEDTIESLRAELADVNRRFIEHMTEHVKLRGRFDKMTEELARRRADHDAHMLLYEIIVKDNLDLRQQLLEATQVVEPILETGGTSQKGESLCQEEKTESTSTQSTA